MTEPNEHYAIEEPEAKVYKTENQWYVEITVPHPNDETLPPQLAAIPVPTEWWARFIGICIEETTLWESIKEGNLPNFDDK